MIDMDATQTKGRQDMETYEYCTECGRVTVFIVFEGDRVCSECYASEASMDDYEDYEDEDGPRDY